MHKGEKISLLPRFKDTSLEVSVTREVRVSRYASSSLYESRCSWMSREKLHDVACDTAYEVTICNGVLPADDMEAFGGRGKAMV